MNTQSTSHSTPPESAQNTADSDRFNPFDAARLLRSAGGALFAQAALHSKLARVEWAEEKARLMNMALTALAGFAFLLCFLFFAGLLLIALAWDTEYRISTMLIIAAVHAVAVLLAVIRFRALSDLAGQAFAATREEIAADIALIKSKL